MASEIPMVHMWRGRPITDFTREELLEVIDYIVRDLADARETVHKILNVRTMAGTFRQKAWQAAYDEASDILLNGHPSDTPNSEALTGLFRKQ